MSSTGFAVGLYVQEYCTTIIFYIGTFIMYDTLDIYFELII